LKEGEAAERYNLARKGIVALMFVEPEWGRVSTTSSRGWRGGSSRPELKREGGRRRQPTDSTNTSSAFACRHQV